MDTIVQRAAAAAFAGAVGFAVERTSSGTGFAIGAGLAAYVVCFVVLKRVGDHGVQMKVPVFDLRQFEFDELSLTDIIDVELVLTEADRVESDLVLADSDREDWAPEPLLLDDVRTEVGAQSRVVQLFDREAMSTAEHHRRCIERNLKQRMSRRSGDASEALSEALADLRRSLR